MSPPAPSLESRPLKTEGLAAADLDGETAVLSVEHGAYFAMDAVGARVFELIDGQRAISDICKLLLEEFDVDRDRCQADILRYVERLCALGLVKLL